MTAGSSGALQFIAVTRRAHTTVYHIEYH